MRNQIFELQKKEHEAREAELDKIIKKIFDYPIASSDKHYEFLKELEKELKEFKKNL